MNEFNDSFEEFQDDIMNDNKLMEMLNEKYFILAVNDIVAYTDLLKAENVDYENKEIMGFDYIELEKLFDVFVNKGVSAIFMQFKLMNELVSGKGLQIKYEFKPLKGENKVGILIPILFVEKDDKPNRDTVVDEIDVGLLGTMTDKFNNGEIDFDTFLNSL
jgi:hypothetical protein